MDTICDIGVNLVYHMYMNGLTIVTLTSKKTDRPIRRFSAELSSQTDRESDRAVTSVVVLSHLSLLSLP